MYAQMPVSLKSQIESLLNTDNFSAAKKIYDHWHDVVVSVGQEETYAARIKKITRSEKMAEPWE